jgi:hypothetical protein
VNLLLDRQAARAPTLVAIDRFRGTRIATAQEAKPQIASANSRRDEAAAFQDRCLDQLDWVLYLFSRPSDPQTPRVN